MFNIAKLTPSVFSGSTVDDAQDPTTSGINLLQMNVLLFKEQLKINGK